MVCEALAPQIGGLVMREVALPEPGPGAVRVRLRAAAINFPDLLMLQGKYQFRPDLPFIPGLEGAGEIEAVGPDMDPSHIGRRVGLGAPHGCYAEAIVVPLAATRPIPAPFSFTDAAAFGAAYLTAYVALVERGNLKPGETLLVHGASGGVGLAAVALGKILGARVIATGGSDEKLAKVQAQGADHVLNVTGDHGGVARFREAVKHLTDGRGADVIYDPVGGDVFDESTHCIAWGGRLLVIGFAGGRISNLDVNWPLIKGYALIGVRAGEYTRRAPERGRLCHQALFDLAEAGRIRPHIFAQLPLEQANEAQALLDQRRVVGKVALDI